MNYRCESCHFGEVCKSKSENICDAYYSLLPSIDECSYDSTEVAKFAAERKREFYNEWFDYLENFYN